MHKGINDSLLEKLLCFSVFFIFLGRAWQHLFWDAPYRALLWDEVLLKPFVEKILGMQWYDYVTSSNTDSAIQTIIFSTGILYVLAAVATLLYRRFPTKTLKYVILLGAWNLMLLSFLLMKEKFYHFAMFFEQSIQFLLPFVFVYYFKGNFVFQHFKLILKILIAIVFISHGLYAIGYYPVPGKFVDMLICILEISEQSAKSLLRIAGVLDFLVAILIFIPKTSQLALWYAFIWGSLTAFARIFSKFEMQFPLQTLHQELFETTYRLAHGLVPLMALLLERNKKINLFAALYNGLNRFSVRQKRV